MYVVDSAVGTIVVNGVTVDMNTIYFCVYPISVLLVPKAYWSSFSSLLLFFTSLMFRYLLFALAHPIQGTRSKVPNTHFWRHINESCAICQLLVTKGSFLGALWSKRVFSRPSVGIVDINKDYLLKDNQRRNFTAYINKWKSREMIACFWHTTLNCARFSTTCDQIAPCMCALQYVIDDFSLHILAI